MPFGGIHLLLLSLTAVWLLTGVSALLPASALALDRVRPWTALTDAWCSPGFDLLARNLFFGYMFGRVVDNVEGSQGLWLSYTLSAAGGCVHASLIGDVCRALPALLADAWLGAAAGVIVVPGSPNAAPKVMYFSHHLHHHNLASLSQHTHAPTPAGGSIAAFSLLPRRAPLAGSSMSAALFGLFATATLFNSRKTWHWHRWFELAVLLPFVALQLTGAQAGLAQWCIIDGVRLGNWVPLLGGLAGAALSAALLQLARAVLAGLRQRQAAAAPGAQGGQQQPPQLPGKDDPLVALIGKAATLLLKRLV